jgi:hypothetical protein
LFYFCNCCFDDDDDYQGYTVVIVLVATAASTTAGDGVDGNDKLSCLLTLFLLTCLASRVLLPA